MKGCLTKVVTYVCCFPMKKWLVFNPFNECGVIREQCSIHDAFIKQRVKKLAFVWRKREKETYQLLSTAKQLLAISLDVLIRLKCIIMENR